MNDLFMIAAHNTVVALVLALCVFALTRVWRSPPVAHVLWLLVLVKLVAPPVMQVNWSALRLPAAVQVREQIVAGAATNEAKHGEKEARLVDRPTDRANTEGSPPSVPERYIPLVDLAESLWLFWSSGKAALFWLWIGGAALCALVAVMRVVRFERLLRDTLPASERVQKLTFEIAGKLGIRRVPRVRYVECIQVPMLWCAGGRPTVVMPRPLLDELDEQQIAMILAHELAHLRRGDHWVRAVELVVSIVYWWNPLVWLVRRQVHQTEDLCCDAWVRWAFPDCTKRYAEVVLLTAESLRTCRVGARVLLASQFLRSLSLKARIEMILQSPFTPRVSRKSMLFIGLLALVILPTWIQAGADSNDNSAAASGGESSATTNSEFPFTVRFEQGATRFEPGDEITITQVRGTAETFLPGNIYWIKGTYKLTSRDRAGLSAYTTAAESKDGTSTPYKVQSVRVERGSGTFTLFLPMSCRGWPHVSFYPVERGEGFGGNYFGTGESVLKQWWGSKETDRKPTTAPAGSSNIDKPNDRQTKLVSLNNLTGETTASGSQSEGDPTRLSYNDGMADGKKSIGGSGEMIHFELPGDEAKVTAIRIHGSRYGTPQPPKENFSITFLKDDMSDAVGTQMAPYSLFKRGAETWVQINLAKPVVVPKSFWIALDFHAGPTKGIYVSYDKSTGGKHSRVGLPGMEPKETGFDGDWMIEAILAK